MNRSPPARQGCGCSSARSMDVDRCTGDVTSGTAHLSDRRTHRLVHAVASGTSGVQRENQSTCTYVRTHACRQTTRRRTGEHSATDCDQRSRYRYIQRVSFVTQSSCDLLAYWFIRPPFSRKAGEFRWTRQHLKQEAQLSSRDPRVSPYRLKCCPTVVRTTQTDRVLAGDFQQLPRFIPLPAL